MAQQDTTAARQKDKARIAERSSDYSKSFENHHIILDAHCGVSGLREHPVLWNRIGTVVVDLSPLLPKFQHAGGDLPCLPQRQRLEGVAQKLRIFAAVVSEPAVPERISAHTVVRDAIIRRR